MQETLGFGLRTDGVMLGSLSDGPGSLVDVSWFLLSRWTSVVSLCVASEGLLRDLSGFCIFRCSTHWSGRFTVFVAHPCEGVASRSLCTITSSAQFHVTGRCLIYVTLAEHGYRKGHGCCETERVHTCCLEQQHAGMIRY